MSLESLSGASVFLNALVNTNPVSATDPVSQGDDHLRGIKNVLLNSFPAINGAVTATHTEINLLHGLLSLPFPAGTKMSFFQAAAPTGWTQDVSDDADNRMLRVVKTAGGGVAGTHSPILNNVVTSHTHTVTTGTESAYHTHVDSGHSHYVYGSDAGESATNTRGQMTYAGSEIAIPCENAYAALGNESATHTHSGTTAAPAGAANWAPRYVDMIICSKD